MFAAVLAASLILSQPPASAPATPPAPAPVSAPVSSPVPAPAPVGVEAAIADAAFLAGDWSASRPSQRGGSEFVQEVWTAPSGNNMMGMFRWVNPAGKAIVFEILTIVEEGGSLTLRLRHQSAAGVAWEEKDEPATFTLAAKTATRLEFVDSGETNDLSACVYECPTPDTLVITVKFDNSDNPDLVFNLARAK